MSASLILSIIGIYFLVLFVISWVTGKDSSNEAFFIGNKKSPWYLVAFGMIGASLSGVTFISVPGVVGNLSAANANSAFSYMQMVMGYMVGYAVIGTVLMPLYYRLNLTSIYTYLEQRFGYWSYKTGAFFFLVSRTLGASFRVFLVAIVLQQFVFDAWGLPFAVNVLFTLLLIWVYTLKGGIRTIVFTDALQTTFMILAVVTAVWWIAQDMNLSVGQLIGVVENSEFSKWFYWDNFSEKRHFLKQFIGGMFIAIAMTGLDQDMMQKNNSCKNIREAQKNMFSFSVVIFFVNLLFLGLGALLYIYIQSKGIDMPLRDGKVATDLLFPTLALNYFPVGVGIVFLIGLIAAAYSSADSALTALTTSFCIDFLGFEKQKGKVSEKQLKRTRYKVHVAFTALLLFVICFFYYVLSKDVLGNLFKMATFTYGPLLGLYTFGLFVKGRNITDYLAPFVCIASLVLCIFLDKFSMDLFNGYQIGFELLLINGTLTFLGLLLISNKEEGSIAYIANDNNLEILDQ